LGAILKISHTEKKKKDVIMSVQLLKEEKKLKSKILFLFFLLGLELRAYTLSHSSSLFL
jgi:hypothetical protein